MRIPGAIDQNTLKAYEAHPRAILGHSQTLESYNLQQWDRQIPKCLQELCVEAVAQNWAEKPILDEIVLSIDRYHLLDILDTDLPLTLTVPKIPDDVYWKRCYLTKWPKQIPGDVKPIDIQEIIRDNGARKLVHSANGSSSSENSCSTNLRQSRLQKRESSSSKNLTERSWKEYYLEMYIKEYLENLKPEEYDAEKMKELSDLCFPYVKVLRMDQLRCSENSSNRIPLNLVLSGLQQLTELSICFKQTYAGEQFSWNILKTAYQDIRLFAKGLEKLRLRVLRIRNSDINCEKLIMVLKALLKHDIKVLDFCHCKIGDKGAQAIAKFVLEVPVRELILANNRVGPKGLEFLSFALRQSNCAISTLDLHLNHLEDEAGNLLLKSLQRNNQIKNLFLGGCGFSDALSAGRLLQTNRSLEFLDVSNNNLGEKVGVDILEGLKNNHAIKRLDLRMCNIPTETEFDIQELVKVIRKGRIFSTEQSEDDSKEELNDEQLKLELETILQ